MVTVWTPKTTSIIDKDYKGFKSLTPKYQIMRLFLILEGESPWEKIVAEETIPPPARAPDLLTSIVATGSKVATEAGTEIDVMTEVLVLEG